MNKDIFAGDIHQGLSAKNKYLPSKYFYDEEGDKLFEAIMNLPEYYLTRAEYDIFSTQQERIREILQAEGRPFRLIEFGAGNGLKTKVLLKHFLDHEVDFEYVPVDISSHVLQVLRSDLAATFPGLKVNPIADDYFRALQRLKTTNGKKNVVLFLGSNIGNFRNEMAVNFLNSLSNELNLGDQAMIGFDLKKNPVTILEAYNDPTGITRAFNLNILRRINRELEADFDLTNFEHYPLYDPESGEARSYIVSMKKQDVYIGYLKETYSFKWGETIHTEISKKYSLREIEELAERSGFTVTENLFDCRHYFTDSVWTKSE